MRTGPSLAWRVGLAVTLMAIYIVLALAAIAGLAALGFVMLIAMSSSGHANIGGGILALASIIAAGVIAWSLFPRRDKFVPPGPEIRAADHPALFAEIARLADLTGEAQPAHVYLMWDVNAFVAQRGGVMGFGSKRVMGLGLPLMRALTVGELRGVVAHELGHFYGGDTKLGPWIYKTRSAVIRTVMNLAQAQSTGAQISQIAMIVFAVALAPFRWFGKAFIRITQAVSRGQERSADRVAMRCAGRPAVIAGLKKTHAAALAHQIYLQRELAPLIAQGHMPPPGEGFARFLGVGHVAKLLDEAIESELREGKGDPYDSHPPLRERIAALEDVADDGPSPDDRPAVELLTDAARVEAELLTSKLEAAVAPIAWSETARVWEQRWRQIAAHLGKHARGTTIATIPATPSTIRELAGLIEGPAVTRASDADLRGWAVMMFGAALCVALIDAGWTASAELGEPIRLRRGDEVIEPMAELGAYLSAKTSGAWRAKWEARGVADRALGATP